MAESVKETAAKDHNLASTIEQMGGVHARAYELTRQIRLAMEAHVQPLKDQRKKLVKNACTDAGINVKQFNRFHAIYQDEQDAGDFEDEAETDKVKLGLEINYRALAKGAMVDWVKTLEEVDEAKAEAAPAAPAATPAAPAPDPLEDPAPAEAKETAKKAGAKKAPAKKKVDLVSPPKKDEEKPALLRADYERWLTFTQAHDTDEAMAFMRMGEKGWATFSAQAKLAEESSNDPLKLLTVDDGGTGALGVLVDTEAMDDLLSALRADGYDVVLMMDGENATLQPAFEDA